jgi:ElaB/YqjD/DUF883 family membrane-anchored ribosome-binding protein
MEPDSLLFEDLPAEARELIDQVEREVAELRQQADDEVSSIRTRMEQAIEEIQERADQAMTTVRERTDQAARQRLGALVERLKPLQTAYTRAGQLDEALAIRARIRQVRVSLMNVRPDPGTLMEFETQDAGRSILFEVTGNTTGAVWGTDVYTSDSTLATAAVHMGILAPGERGIVRATIVDGANVEWEGSDRNGVWSESFGPHPVGFQLDRP